mmetsp:Transcript_28745/g.80933  ORF Transcript_28745/g.80933 Transcript_28745/m.80933 type:complete len:236 (-) Transcript_28745:383-1090(-)
MLPSDHSTASILSERRVGSLPKVHYIPEYVTEVQEARLLEEVRSSKAKWTQVSGRRLQNHGGIVHSTGCLIAQPLPSWLRPVAERMHRDTGIFGGEEPNHVLINSYQPGEGIMPHEDGPLYHPGVCILSLGAPAVVHFFEKPGHSTGEGGEDNRGARQARGSVACMPRSLLVFSGEAYTNCLHGINEAHEEVVDKHTMNLEAVGLRPGDALPRGGERISFTVRRVLKVKKNLIRL